MHAAWVFLWHPVGVICQFENKSVYLLIVMGQLQSNMQQRIERERKELEQGHVRIIKEYESRVRDLDGTNRVSCVCVETVFSDNNNNNPGFICPIRAPGVLFTIMCIRMQKFLPYVSSAISHTCCLLSFCKNFLTYVQLSIIVFYL